jgi:hypothetical protein
MEPATLPADDSGALVGSVLWTYGDCARQVTISTRTHAGLHIEGKGPPRVRVVGKKVFLLKRISYRLAQIVGGRYSR